MDINTTTEAIIIAKMQFDFWKEVGTGVMLTVLGLGYLWAITK